MTKDEVMVGGGLVLAETALGRIWVASQLHSWAKESNYSD